jgi:negative regulator of flagellin synthesis FlgM
MQKSLGSSSVSPVNIDRVNSVKKALADGSYSINASETAAKLIQFEKQLPQERNTSP